MTMQEKNAIIHPRPQLTRTRWIDLGGAWDFAYDDTGQGCDEGWQERVDVYTQTIQVPFPPESSASGIGDTRFHPIVWYRRTFLVSPHYRRRGLLLHIAAVIYRRWVCVSARLVATYAW